MIRVSTNSSGGEHPYVAATLVRPGLLAAVTRRGVTWLRCGSRSFTPIGLVPLPLPAALACFPSPRAGELVVVSGEGALWCLPIPT